MLPRAVVTLTLILSVGPVNAGPDRKSLRQHCSADYTIYCADHELDGPEVQACFRKNMANLSPACRTEIERNRDTGRKD